MNNNHNIIDKYKCGIRKKIIVLVSLIVLTFIFLVVSVSVGASGISFWEVLKALFGVGDEVNIIIVYNLRLPRVLAGIIAGAGLAISGCVMQTVLRNPMASPSTLGVSNASVFGANFAIIVLGVGSYLPNQADIVNINNPYVVTICAFVFALICVGVILLLTYFKHFSNEAIVLSGVALGSIFQAGTTIVQFFASDTQVASAVYWTFGSLSRATYRENLIMLVVIACSLIYFIIKRWDYTAMAQGMDTAKVLGVNVQWVTIISLLCCSLITAVCVAFLGIIGFVGLIAPQIMKRIVGNSFGFLLTTSLFAGALLLLVADTIGRVLIPGVVLPVGAITSLIGGPMFIYLLLAKGGKKQ